jgi:hypothetical protein
MFLVFHDIHVDTRGGREEGGTEEVDVVGTVEYMLADPKAFWAKAFCCGCVMDWE